MTDPINDIFNQIRNGQAVLKPEISVPFSQLKNNISEILVEEGFISGVKKSLKKDNKVLKITLKYHQGVPAISGLKRMSRPGQRVYIKASEIRSVRGGRGISIISTSRGLMTNKRARKEKLGGEIICKIW